MLYALEQGPVESFILDQSRRNRAPVPQVIQDAPELWLGSTLYYDAFLKLSSCRPIGMSVGRIPWLSVASFARLRRMNSEEAEVLWVVIAEMDDAYLRFVNKEKPKASKEKPPLKSVRQRNGL